MVEVVAPRPKTWAYLMNDGSEHEKAKGTKKAVIKQELMFENYKDCLFNEKNIFKKQQRFKTYYHNMYTEKLISNDSNDNKKVQTFNRVTIFPHRTSDFKVCEDEMLNVRKAKETLKILKY